eukprot:7168380-Alexandrium_andersonii.AAC.1
MEQAVQTLAAVCSGLQRFAAGPPGGGHHPAPHPRRVGPPQKCLGAGGRHFFGGGVRGAVTPPGEGAQ